MIAKAIFGVRRLDAAFEYGMMRNILPMRGYRSPATKPKRRMIAALQSQALPDEETIGWTIFPSLQASYFMTF